MVLPISVPRTSYSAQDTVVERMCAAETCSPPLWYVSGYLLMIPRWHPLLLRASGVTGGTLGGHGTSSSREPDTHPALGLRCVEGRDVALQGDALWHAGPCACFSLTEGGVRSALRQGRLQWKESSSYLVWVAHLSTCCALLIQPYSAGLNRIPQGCVYSILPCLSISCSTDGPMWDILG